MRLGREGRLVSCRDDGSSNASARPRARGKFLWIGEQKVYVRGVTYGTFQPNSAGELYPQPVAAERDFERMVRNHINAIRTYDVPPRWLLDLADRHGLKVMVGLPWEQHITFLDDASRKRSIEERVAAGVSACSGHPAVLCYVIGNEIPSSIVRWHGHRKVEHFLERLYRAAKRQDPEALVTYVNYPSTEYLHLPFLDLVCFNVFLESKSKLEAYLARLQNLAANRPLLIAELGLDSRRNGKDAQAASLDWQVRTAFRTGCAGTFVFSWSDDWQRGGVPVNDWDFGLIDRSGRSKPALAAVSTAFEAAPFGSGIVWPQVSVVVSTHNGGSTLGECLEHVTHLDYPDYEVIVVDDGSTDQSAEIARSFVAVRLIQTEQCGLSSARNTGLKSANGEIVAYIDDDAWPDPDWLSYVALSFRPQDAAVGGPNVPPPSEGMVAECVARAPGGPIHVLLSDREAEHIPGCNMAFRRDALEAVGGFDPQFWVAGDDVDICWRLQAMGWTLGFSPAAMVWHRRRGSLRAYLRQQTNYGKAEALLERKWPERYTRGGHLRWAGRVYSDSPRDLGRWGRRIHYGIWGGGLFQSIYDGPPSFLSSLPLMPQSYLLIAAMMLLTASGLAWSPLLFRLPWIGVPAPIVVMAAYVGFLVTHAFRRGWNAFPAAYAPFPKRVGYRSLTSLLSLSQPVARLFGRLRHGLTPWRSRGRISLAPPWRHARALWSERWQPQTEWLTRLETDLRRNRARIRRGGPFDRWDLEASPSRLGSARMRLTIEEHGQGRQLVRIRVWPCYSAAGLTLLLGVGTLLAYALLSNARSTPAAVLSALAVVVALCLIAVSAAAVGMCLGSLVRLRERTAQSDLLGFHDSPSGTAKPRGAVSLAEAPFGLWARSEAVVKAHE